MSECIKAKKKKDSSELISLGIMSQSLRWPEEA